MKRVKWWIEMGIQGCSYTGEIEVEDDATDEDIDEEVRQEAFDRISWGWDVVETSDAS